MILSGLPPKSPFIRSTLRYSNYPTLSIHKFYKTIFTSIQRNDFLLDGLKKNDEEGFSR